MFFFDFWEEEIVSKIFLQRFDGSGFSSKYGRGFSAFFSVSGSTVAEISK